MDETRHKIGQTNEDGSRVWPALNVMGGFLCRHDTTRSIGDGYFVVIPTGIAPHIIEEKIAEIQSYLAAERAAASGAMRRKARLENGGEKAEDEKN